MTPLRKTMQSGIAVLFLALATNASAALKQLDIRTVFVDIPNEQIYITGKNLKNGPQSKVRFGEFGFLTVDTHTNTLIIVDFPASGVPDGDYLLTVKTGSGFKRYDEFDVTVGAVGVSGADGADGLSCWDLNGNGTPDMPDEDINGDLVIDALDCAGPEGPQGAAGNDGADGADGAPGVDGMDGADGAPGADGQDGADGPQGPPGPQGPQGIQGIAGNDGADGQDGADGAPGMDGADGADGAPGADGLSCWDLNGNGVGDPAEDINNDTFFDALDCAGPQGVAGNDGADGADGAPGMDGADGAPGADGQDGADGPQGPPGPQGPQGIQGIAGNDGADGQDGADGAPGMDGADGTDGLSCWDLNGNGVGDPAEDINSDTFFDALDCAGPEGPQGVAGNDGADGADGAPGMDGADGAPGADGQDGADGPQGPPGPQGPQGIQGIAGNDGADGQDGADGAPGMDGADGAPGADGLSCWDLNGNGVGDPAEDINSDTFFDALDCGGPEGPQGVAGNDGEDGADGAPGMDGADGAPGADGQDGADGAQGPPGPQGPQGIQGVAGNDGADGQDGVDGAPGMDGADGAQGPPGPPGISTVRTVKKKVESTGINVTTTVDAMCLATEVATGGGCMTSTFSDLIRRTVPLQAVSPGNQGWSCTITATTAGTTELTTWALCVEGTQATTILARAWSVDQGGNEILIAQLEDTNNDLVPSIGDTVRTGQYPEDFVGSVYGNFATTTHSVVSVSTATTTEVSVSAASGFSSFLFSWHDIPGGGFPLESYSEFNFGEPGSPSTSIVDSLAAAGSEGIHTDILSPSVPAASIDVMRTPVATDDAFVNVSIN